MRQNPQANEFQQYLHGARASFPVVGCEDALENAVKSANYAFLTQLFGDNPRSLEALYTLCDRGRIRFDELVVCTVYYQLIKDYGRKNIKVARLDTLEQQKSLLTALFVENTAYIGLQNDPNINAYFSNAVASQPAVARVYFLVNHKARTLYDLVEAINELMLTPKLDTDRIYLPDPLHDALVRKKFGPDYWQLKRRVGTITPGDMTEAVKAGYRLGEAIHPDHPPAAYVHGFINPTEFETRAHDNYHAAARSAYPQRFHALTSQVLIPLTSLGTGQFDRVQWEITDFDYVKRLRKTSIDELSASQQLDKVEQKRLIARLLSSFIVTDRNFFGVTLTSGESGYSDFFYHFALDLINSPEKYSEYLDIDTLLQKEPGLTRLHEIGRELMQQDFYQRYTLSEKLLCLRLNGPLRETAPQQYKRPLPLCAGLHLRVAKTNRFSGEKARNVLRIEVMHGPVAIPSFNLAHSEQWLTCLKFPKKHTLFKRAQQKNSEVESNLRNYQRLLEELNRRQWDENLANDVAAQPSQYRSVLICDALRLNAHTVEEKAFITRNFLQQEFLYGVSVELLTSGSFSQAVCLAISLHSHTLLTSLARLQGAKLQTEIELQPNTPKQTLAQIAQTHFNDCYTEVVSRLVNKLEIQSAQHEIALQHAPDLKSLVCLITKPEQAAKIPRRFLINYREILTSELPNLQNPYDKNCFAYNLKIAARTIIFEQRQYSAEEIARLFPMLGELIVDENIQWIPPQFAARYADIQPQPLHNIYKAIQKKAFTYFVEQDNSAEIAKLDNNNSDATKQWLDLPLVLAHKLITNSIRATDKGNIKTHKLAIRAELEKILQRALTKREEKSDLIEQFRTAIENTSKNDNLAQFLHADDGCFTLFHCFKTTVNQRWLDMIESSPVAVGSYYQLNG